MRAQTVSPARMATIDPTLRVDDAISPPKAERSGNQSQLTHRLFCAGAVLALVMFGSFCVLWVQWQMDALRISFVSGDFVSFWTAGELVLEGHAANAYNAVSVRPCQLRTVYAGAASDVENRELARETAEDIRNLGVGNFEIGPLGFHTATSSG